MKFRITASSLGARQREKELIRVLPERIALQKDAAGFYVIIDSLEALLDMVKESNNHIIVKELTSSGEFELEIYDDYRE